MYDQDTNLIFTKKKKKKITNGRFTEGGNGESMTILVGAIRDSSHSGDSSSHIEKMRSTSRASVRERERAIKGKRGKINEKE